MPLSLQPEIDNAAYLGVEDLPRPLDQRMRQCSFLHTSDGRCNGFNHGCRRPLSAEYRETRRPAHLLQFLPDDFFGGGIYRQA